MTRNVIIFPAHWVVACRDNPTLAWDCAYTEHLRQGFPPYP